jgi:histidine ammonia-lyase
MGADRNPIALDGWRLTVADVDAVADGALVELDAAALERVAAGHRTLLEVIERGTPIYAVTRGTGQLWSRTSTPTEREQTARSGGRNRLLYGERFGVRTGRAVMLATINGMLGGRTGVRREYVEHVAAMLNAGITPVLSKDVGLLGIGDLGAMEQLTAGIAGEGRSIHDGVVLSTADAYQRVGLAPLTLRTPEASVVAGTNGVSLGLGALVLAEAEEVALLLDASAALALEGYAANLSMVRPEVAEGARLPGHRAVAERLRALLGRTRRDSDRTLQDALSFRCVPQVHGALADALTFAREGHELLLNGSLVNPMVISDGAGDVFSNGNFDITRVSLAFDMVRGALAEVARMSVERIQKQMWPAFSKLPTGLDPSEGFGRGLNELGRFAAQLAAEVRIRSAPTTGAMTVPLADAINDHMTGTPLGLLATREALDAVVRVIALELIVSAQAVELRKIVDLAPGTAATFAFVRDSVPFLRSRAEWGPDLDAFAGAVRTELPDRLRGVLGEQE